jgi:mannose/cellobiose epimerase-like protein (N-acyl-D-glucosamine 2-epimerase family)
MGRNSYPYSDTLAGQVTAVEPGGECFSLRTRAGQAYQVARTPVTTAERLRNLGDPYQDCRESFRELLEPGQHVFALGLFYQDSPDRCEARHLIFCGPEAGAWEQPGWWVRQVRALGEFLLRAELPTAAADYSAYTTVLARSGRKVAGGLQDANSLSRFVYGMATAFLLTGEDRFLHAAEQGAAYLRSHFRIGDDGGQLVLWHHALDRTAAPAVPVLGSPLPDDGGAISAFDQIYALAGPAQLYRVTGDPRLRADVEGTARMFDRYFHDPVLGGYFSHLDPATRDPRSPRLGQNRARKNWNSVGDHAPAYLVNLWLATGDVDWARRLEHVFDMVGRHFPDFDHSPFVRERFHEDWSPDAAWGWQQDRGLVGHNLKIAWNLVRVGQLIPKAAYRDLALRIAAAQPGVGLDRQRGGWYDAFERRRRPGEQYHRFVWHDRKAWWQQEQAILAFLLLGGVTGNPDCLRLARESAAFYNAFFLDHDEGGIFLEVAADGSPILTGDDRYKTNHSASAYHTFELAFLAAAYHDLLIARRPVDLHFKPCPDGFADGVLRVAPDLLPPGAIRIEAVWVDDRPFPDFDAAALTVARPPVTSRPTVRVRLAPC